jgi:hypothetical protein
MCGDPWLVVITRKKREQKETKKKTKKKNLLPSASYRALGKHLCLPSVR